ncbi:aminoglycoside phosphotransferase family protein [Robiginitomaculum antarcticum]|uniref:aminoglycoside phosphotransferase family protein n=1 Tax=Robiginitomaculum antarcticum TaxID=437507 RepID=UPI00037A55D8|nr:phosphotransferase [Robiginitomaculum antarcticum]
MSDREVQITDFLTVQGWAAAAQTLVPGDASARRYRRLTHKDGRKAVLMDAPVNDAAPSDYVQTAKISDGKMVAFTAVSQQLSMRGFSAPKIYGADIGSGLLLLEDMGDDLYASVLAATPGVEKPLYEAAVDCLAALYRSTFPADINSFGQSWTVRDYDPAALLAETDLLLEWYAPHKGLTLDKAAMQAAWRQAFAVLNSQPHGLVLRDFHAENIFWLPERQSVFRVGLIDFQDAVMGHPAYDLVSLLEDARRKVSVDITDALITRFCDKAVINDEAGFRTAYAVLGAQRNAKILGIFVRLAKRDGKDRYLDLLPHVEALFAANLAHPALSKVKDIFDGAGQ